MSAAARAFPQQFVARGRSPRTDATALTAETHHGGMRVVLTGDVPAWVEAVSQSIPRLLALPDNWDGYGSKSTDLDLAVKAFLELAEVMESASPAPSIVPLGDGGLQMEWHRSPQHLEIEFSPGVPTTFDYYSDQSDDFFEGELPAARVRLREIIRAIAQDV